MNLKKLLCVCLALVLALAVTGCSSNKDVQAQLEAANVGIAELQAELDAANTSVADLQAQLDAANATIAELQAAEPVAAEADNATEPALGDSDAEAKIAELMEKWEVLMEAAEE